MEVAVDFLAGDNPDVFGQEPFEGPQPALRRNRARRVEVADLAQRVDAGIGAARPGDAGLPLRETRHDGLQLALNAGCGGLYLPPGVARAAVRNGESDAHGALLLPRQDAGMFRGGYP